MSGASGGGVAARWPSPGVRRTESGAGGVGGGGRREVRAGRRSGAEAEVAGRETDGSIKLCRLIQRQRKIEMTWPNEKPAFMVQDSYSRRLQFRHRPVRLC